VKRLSQHAWDGKASTVAAVLYLGLSLLAAFVFVALAALKGETSWSARLIGGVWVFFLTTIILMPVVIPWVRKHAEGR
jgi:uncharacterized membrane protein YagU involved in acid resistance